MSAQAIALRSCPNGHGGPAPEGGQFCTRCGSRLIAMHNAAPNYQSSNAVQY